MRIAGHFARKGEPTSVEPATARNGIQRRSQSSRMSAKPQAVLVALCSHPEPVEAAKLAEELGMSIGEVRRALGHLRELRLASAYRLRGSGSTRGNGNVWSAV